MALRPHLSMSVPFRSERCLALSVNSSAAEGESIRLEVATRLSRRHGHGEWGFG